MSVYPDSRDKIEDFRLEAVQEPGDSGIHFRKPLQGQARRRAESHDGGHVFRTGPPFSFVGAARQERREFRSFFYV